MGDVRNGFNDHAAGVERNGDSKVINIQAKACGYGSSLSGGELLFLAMATCFCNDVYREAAKRGIKVNVVEVSVSGDFGAECEPASNIVYSAKIDAEATQEEISKLIRDTDKLAEVQDTLRKGVSVGLPRQ